MAFERYKSFEYSGIDPNDAELIQNKEVKLLQQWKWDCNWRLNSSGMTLCLVGSLLPAFWGTTNQHGAISRKSSLYQITNQHGLTSQKTAVGLLLCVFLRRTRKLLAIIKADTNYQLRQTYATIFCPS